MLNRTNPNEARAKEETIIDEETTWDNIKEAIQNKVKELEFMEEYRGKFCIHVIFLIPPRGFSINQYLGLLLQ